MKFQIELTEEQASLLKSMNAIFPTGETYGYFRLPWIKLEMGSNIGRVYNFEHQYPADLEKVLNSEMCFEQWVWKHATAGLTEPLNFSKYNKLVDSWSIKVDGKEIVNPSLSQVWELYQKSKKTYVSPTFELYECMICKEKYKISKDSLKDKSLEEILKGLKSFGNVDGCCTAESLRTYSKI